MIKKFLKVALVVAASTMIGLLSLVAYMSLARPTTPTIEDENNRVIPGSIASLETVNLGGWRQSILIRGRDTTRPVLLFVHGGPGMPMMYLAHAFQRELENYFVCVQWDQRGAGKSFSENTPVETMNVEQFISDAHDLVEILRKRFNKEKIYLAGHSWGSYLGILLAKRYPQLFSAYVGMGQIVDVQKAREITGTYLRTHAHEVGNQEALRDLEANGRNAYETWLFAFGNELYDKTSWLPLLAAGLFCPEYTFRDVMNVAKGPRFSSKHMKYNAIKGEIMDEVTELALPVYFFTGRYDYVTPTELVRAYCEKLKAPRKQIVWFEHSAHFPFFEEPKKFTEEMLKVLEETRSPSIH